MKDKKTVRKILDSEIIAHAADAADLAKKRQIRVIAASGRADRVGDIVKVDGIKLQNYKKNPVVLYGHDHYALPIGRAVDMGVEDGKLMMTFEFADAETYAFADTVYKLVKGGFIKGVSIGARILEAEWIKDDNDRVIGRQYNELELLEVSVVAIPADSKALVTAVKSGAVSEQEFEDYLSKSFDLPLDTDPENTVEEKSVGVSTDTEDEAMKEQLAALEKRLEALETLLKAQVEAQGVAKQVLEKLSESIVPLVTRHGGNAVTIAPQAMAMIEAMTKRLSKA